MSKRTKTKMMRGFDLINHSLIKRSTPSIATLPEKRIIHCGLFSTSVLATPGQLINEKKVCKKYHEKNNTEK